MVYIISKSGKALMPSKREAHIRRLCNKGKARILSHTPFVVQLKYDTSEETQALYGGTDPGRTNIGEAVITSNGKSVYQAHVESRSKDIRGLMNKRKEHRQASRRGERLRKIRRAKKQGTVKNFTNGRILPGCEKPVMLKDIRNTEAKFNNRCKKSDRPPNPTVLQLVQTHINMVKQICRIMPVTDWTMEINRFAFMKMDDDTCYGADFQNGRMKGYSSVREYVRARQNGHCYFCGAGIDHYHHLVLRSRGGSDLPENIVSTC